MEGEDEEFEKLLGEIPQAMESTTQLDGLESSENVPFFSALAPSKEGIYMVQSHSVDSLHGNFHAFQLNADFESCDEECLYSTHSDGIVNSNAYMGFLPPFKFEYNKAAADASLTTAFANLGLEVSSPIQSNFASHHHTQASLDTPHMLSSTWVADASSFESNSKYMRPVAHAIADELLLGIPKNGAYGHLNGRPLGLEHKGALFSQCSGGNNSTYWKTVGLNSGIDCARHIRVMPNQPFKRQVPIPCSDGDEGLANFFLDRKDGWQHTSEMVARLQAQQLNNLKLLQEGVTIDQVLAHYSQDFVDAEYSNGLPAFSVGRDHGFGRLGVGGTFSCEYPIRQKLVSSHVDNLCTCCTQDVYSRLDDSAALSGKPIVAPMDKAIQISSALCSNGLLKDPTASPLFNEKAQVRILSRKSARVAAPASAPLEGWCLNDNNVSIYRGKGGCMHCSAALPNGSVGQENLATPAWGLHKTYPFTGAMQQGPIYSSLADIEGRILAAAKDQHGCRFLQRKFDEGAVEDVQKIFSEVVDHAVDLMVDPFGNYLIQKLLEVCTDDQRLDLLKSISSKGGLVNVCLNTHGTRAVQKLVETLKSRQHVAIVTASLRCGVVTLIKDLNGNHVIQRCLQHLSNEDNKFIFEAAAYNCVEIATHRHGCCVLQRCIDHSTGVSRQNLIWEIASNSLRLAQDSFGNYVVQYVLELGLPWAIKEVIHRLVENYAHLSMQKFSSNVVEKCLKLSEEESRVFIVQELIDSSQLLQLLQDPYANYVIQSALMVSKGALHASLVEAIRPHVPSLRNSPYGKRILSRKSLKKF